ncbi:MAG TPA: LacI family DNA-binding transcriptional regulator [Candidatus Goldiibacteriota bacterium]|mgnify:CR=1 FL=1|nr:LacI family DNA-binding transcriptional regulator [Candidatus Goldiibacteriota bacterium]
MKRVTVQDIAQRAGVTKATVSMVVTGSKRIGKETRAKIMDIVRELNYIPNESARKLALGRSGVIAVIAPRYNGPYMMSVLNEFEEKSFATGSYLHSIQAYSTMHKNDIREKLLKQIFYGRKADAVVLISLRPDDETVELFRSEGIPLILLENKVKGTHSISIDNEAGVYKAADYLIKKYGKKITFISSMPARSKNAESNPIFDARLSGFKRALSDNKIEFRGSMVAYTPDFDYREAPAAYKELKRNNDGIDSILCSTGDKVAFGIIEEIKKDGLNVPDDIAVIGFDDFLPLTMTSSPKITTIRQDFSKIGGEAFDMVMKAIKDKPEKDMNVIIQPELIIRESA